MSKKIRSSIKQLKDEDEITPFESLLLRNTLDIDAAGKGVSAQLVEQLDRALQTSIAKLEKLDPDRIFTRKRLIRTIAEISGTLALVKDKYLNIIDSARRVVIREEYASLAKEFAKEIDQTIAAVKIPVKRVENILKKPLFGRRMQSWVSRHLTGVVKLVRKELSQSVILGEGIGKANRRLMKVAGISRKNADILSRTALLKASTDARTELYKDNRDVIKQFRYIATLDNRTCPICAPDDGLVAKNLNQLPQPPRHPRCRCIIVPETRFAVPIDRPAVVKTSIRKIKHRDGTTSTKFTPEKVNFTTDNYEKFFNSQPESWQREVLGPKKFELFKEKNLKLSDLRVAGRNRVLTLKQLERKFGSVST